MPSLKMTGKARLSIKVDCAQLAANARISAFTMVTSLLIQYRSTEEELGMSGPTLTIHMTIGIPAIQKPVRQCPMPSEFRSFEPVATHLSGSISRQAIAALSGLPQETVRRIVNGLIADGRVISVGRDAVSTPPGTSRRDLRFLTRLGVLTLDGRGELKERPGVDAARAARATGAASAGPML